ncbi:hypothetical protein QFW77_17625 [Luteimonas sp. RD2P54]|uniref:DUF2339 domain-containing protein n=1 Tax=Luteimonas endophytica TaxID=3042023 RepID=A0ABT6JDA6_9GAMM|nr:hypothetical protein [Luteimonas endophytica]MDH5824792.1 hypothetical protein [Luteimonas endophytica]
MRLLVLLSAIAMPLVAWLSQRGMFGPDQGTVSDRYPTLLVAAGYAFSIWGLIFLLDLAYAAWQATGGRRREPLLGRIALPAALGFALTAAWMPLFSQGLFWLCLVVIFAALACLGWCALLLSRPGTDALAWAALSLHAGWLSLAAFLNLAQAILAYRWLPTGDMLGWSLALFATAAAVLLGLNQRMRGNLAYVAAALWGLGAVYVKQSRSGLDGAEAAAWTALAIALLLGLQTLWLRRRGGGMATPLPGGG